MEDTALWEHVQGDEEIYVCVVSITHVISN